MPKKNKDKSGIVYSTNPDYNYQFEQADENETLQPNKQMLKVSLDKKQRGGKEVTLIDGFIGKNEDLEKLGKELKTKCGTGGAVKDGQILIQGDHRKKIADLLTMLGYKFKFTGG